MKKKGSGLVFILSAPSGAGKTTLIRKVMEELSGLQFSVSCTTRPPRAGEKDGEDYYFVSHSLFQKMVERGEFLEWAEVLGNYYGTGRPNLKKLDSEGMDLILDIDIQGAQRVLQQMEHAIAIFILPPSPELLQERLVRRGLDPPEIIERRLGKAKKEIEEAHWYHYLILNDELEETVETLKALIIAERCRKEKHSILDKKMKEWEAYDGKNHR
ncbi:MAG: guanylate kinase [Deltaproteobacteria bacterium RBG_16_48_10]|nr:MAG: guanylate kinase [Deltaproteobacteria bacterium RBG_16_48_10]